MPSVVPLLRVHLMRDPSDPYADEIAASLPDPAPKLDRPWHLTPEAIAACTLCNSDGYQVGHGAPCRHQDYTAAAERGKQACIKALNKET